MTATVLSHFLADDVRFEVGGKVTAVGMYYHVVYQNLSEAEDQNLVIFCTITDVVEGSHSISVRMSDFELSKSLNVEEQQFFSDGEDFISPFVMKMPGLVFPHSGSYSYTIFVDGEEVVENFFSIKYREEPENKKRRVARKRALPKSE